MTLILRGASHGIQILSDRGKAKIRDPRATNVIHKDIRLDTCECGGKKGLNSITYSLEVTMNYVAEVKKV